MLPLTNDMNFRIHMCFFLFQILLQGAILLKFLVAETHEFSEINKQNYGSLTKLSSS